MPEAFRAALSSRSLAPRLVAGAGPGGMDLVDCGDGLAYPLLPGLDSLEPHAARSWIDVSLFSVPPPGVAGLPHADAVAVARACNDEFAALEPRFRGLALLPLGSGDVATAELERCAGLGLVGASLPSNFAGRALDGEEYRPLFAAAERLSMPLVLHPAPPVDSKFVGDFGLLTTLGFVYDTSVATARLVLSGVFERHPALVLLLPHAGATLTALLGRFDYELELMGMTGQLSTPASEQLRMLHVDSICESEPALEMAIGAFGLEQVMYGSDEPYWSADRSRATVDALALGDEDAAALLGGNARRVFGL